MGYGFGKMKEKIQISKELIALQRLIVPEMISLMENRYNILSTVKSEGPIGRRNLAFVLEMSERQVRIEVDFLEENQLLVSDRQGVELTVLGQEAILRLKQMLYAYNGLEQMERDLEARLHLKKAIICPGSADVNDQVLQFMGHAAAAYIHSILGEHDIIALTGGVSTAAVAAQMPEMDFPHVEVIPARGGIGKSHSTQANNVVAEMALKLHCNYELLHLPDNIDSRLLEAMKDYPEIRRVFEKINAIDVLLFGVGRADALADWRHLKLKEKQMLLENGAVGEAFGYYFDIQGGVVSPSSTIGVSIDRYKEIPYPIAVAGGEAKAEAIIGVSRMRSGMVLVTDESAARAILKKVIHEDSF